MSYKRSIDELDFGEPSAPAVAKRKVEELSLLKHEINATEADGQDSDRQIPELMLTTDHKSSCEAMADSDSEDECDTDPDIIIPYLNRFRESYESSLEIYTSRLDKLELSDALKCTNDLFAVAIDNYTKEHNGFAHNTRMDMSGVDNVRREFEELLDGRHHREGNENKEQQQSSYQWQSSDGSGQSSGQGSSQCQSTSNASRETHDSETYCYPMDEKLSKVLSLMSEIEVKICADMRSIYSSYEQLLSSLIQIEYRLAIIIEMFHHMTDIDPNQFLPSLPFMQNVPDLIGYINSLYDQELDLTLKDESTSVRMQAIVSQFRAMHKRIRDAMDGLHALSCIIMEKKTEVIDRVHTFYKKAEQIFFSEPSFMFQTKDTTTRCL